MRDEGYTFAPYIMKDLPIVVIKRDGIMSRIVIPEMRKKQYKSFTVEVADRIRTSWAKKDEVEVLDTKAEILDGS